jgi:hypothetical protein
MLESAAHNPPRCGHRTQADVEPSGPVRQVPHDEWEQRAENPGADAVEDLDAQSVTNVGHKEVQ